MTDLSLLIRPEVAGEAATIEKLHERAFGPGRFARTAYRLREGAPHEPGLSFTALVGTLVVGSIRLTRIQIGQAEGILLGPVTVEPAFMNRGIGMALVRRSLEAAKAQGHKLVLLVGDEPFYGRVGFKRVPNGRLQMPGPVDPARLLILELEPGAFEGVSGPVGRLRKS
ncbi:GNAT family N-acetyltransferase [Alsobacter soli]|uniref:GNAT family N-acetyltransferase n=1 Tax=Alsobacter soli TaxID=2109933 RepID=A0A2T1HYU0_9HYPH|nr:N-acetyltransferase [Alsobacter soli]PSC06857.1 GNAT family N-acetyltransferase [Alsobacter soli]